MCMLMHTLVYICCFLIMFFIKCSAFWNKLHLAMEQSINASEFDEFQDDLTSNEKPASEYIVIFRTPQIL